MKRRRGGGGIVAEGSLRVDELATATDSVRNQRMGLQNCKGRHVHPGIRGWHCFVFPARRLTEEENEGRKEGRKEGRMLLCTASRGTACVHCTVQDEVLYRSTKHRVQCSAVRTVDTVVRRAAENAHSDERVSDAAIRQRDRFLPDDEIACQYRFQAS